MKVVRTGRVSYRWIAMAVFLVGTFMVVLDTTIVNLALPSLQHDFHTIDGVEWVVTSYLAAVGVSQMASSWVADKIGRKRAFVITLLVFTIGSALCAAAPTLPLLVLARVLQGSGGGMMIPITMAMIYELFDPEERGQAIGIWGLAVMAAPALGPVLGGTVVSEIGWRWLFLINLPIGVVAIPAAISLLREMPGGEPRRLDGSGLIAAAAGIVLLLVGLSDAGTNGFDAPGAFVPLALSIVVLVGFVRHSLQVRAPVIDLRVLAQPVFSRAIWVLVITFAANLARLVYIPLELGSTRDISALTIGLVLLPQAIGTAITMPIGGRLTDRIGARGPVLVGIVLFAGSFWPLAHLSSDTPLEFIAGCLFVGGLGSGLAMMPPNVVAMNSVTANKLTHATALSQVLRQLSAAAFTAVLATIFASTRPDGNLRSAANLHDTVHAYDTVFLVVFAISVLSFVLALRLPGKEEALELQAERRRERGLFREIGDLPA